MSKTFMTEDFWDKESVLPPGEKLTFREAWEQAVARVADHFVENGLRQKAEALQDARDWLETVALTKMSYNPGMSKWESVEGVADTYLGSKNIDWTMAAHSLLQVSVNRGETNKNYQPFISPPEDMRRIRAKPQP